MAAAARVVPGELVMRLKSIPSSWIDKNGYRFDCNPYMSGGIEAKVLLDSLECEIEALSHLTKGGAKGIYHAGREKRHWVTSKEFGIPFLGSTDIFKADLSGLPLMSKKQVARNKAFTIEEGWTLITRTGTTGRMVFSGSNLSGMACSEHVMRVIPDEARVDSGYMYTFLKSRYGVPLVVAGTYGSIIQSIEPEHIASLPVPRIGVSLEAEIGNLIRSSVRFRQEAEDLLAGAVSDVDSLCENIEVPKYSKIRKPDIKVVNSNKIKSALRFDPFFYGSSAELSDRYLTQLEMYLDIKTVGEVVKEVFETTRFGRVSIDDPAYGCQFFSITDMVQFDPKPDSYISKKQADSVRAVVEKGWLILPRVGQLNGVFGTACYIPDHLDKVAVSDNNIRIIPNSEEDGAYLWAALSTSTCYQQIIRRACGTSIPYLDAHRVKQIPMPWPCESRRKEIALKVIDAMKKRSLASENESKAVAMLEKAIERMAKN